MGLITTKYDVGEIVQIKAPELLAQVMAIVYSGYTLVYRLVYWQQGVAFFYEAYDYELQSTKEDELESEKLEDDDEAVHPG